MATKLEPGQHVTREVPSKLYYVKYQPKKRKLERALFVTIERPEHGPPQIIIRQKGKRQCFEFDIDALFDKAYFDQAKLEAGLGPRRRRKKRTG